MKVTCSLVSILFYAFILACISNTDAWTTNKHVNRQNCLHRLSVANPDFSSELAASTSASSSDESSSSKKSKKRSFSKDVVDWDWKAVAKDVFENDARPIVLFDGVCNLCNGGVNFAIDHDEEAKLRFTSLQSKVAQSLLLRSGLDPQEANIVLVTKDGAYFSSDAVSRICMKLDADSLRMLGQVGLVTPNWIREALYKYVSSNRYFFGENDQCRIDFDGTYTSRFVSDPMDSSSSS